MALFETLILRRKTLKAAQELAGEAYIRAQRLEITVQGLEMRIAALEGRLSGLDHTVRGRLGGRPPKQPAQGVVPLPVGAQLFPPATGDQR